MSVVVKSLEGTPRELVFYRAAARLPRGTLPVRIPTVVAADRDRMVLLVLTPAHPNPGGGLHVAVTLPRS